MPCWCNGSAYRATNAEIRFKSCTGYLRYWPIGLGTGLPNRIGRSIRACRTCTGFVQARPVHALCGHGPAWPRRFVANEETGVQISVVVFLETYANGQRLGCLPSEAGSTPVVSAY